VGERLGAAVEARLAAGRLGLCHPNLLAAAADFAWELRVRAQIPPGGRSAFAVVPGPLCHPVAAFAGSAGIRDLVRGLPADRSASVAEEALVAVVAEEALVAVVAEEALVAVVAEEALVAVVAVVDPSHGHHPDPAAEAFDSLVAFHDCCPFLLLCSVAVVHRNFAAYLCLHRCFSLDLVC